QNVVWGECKNVQHSVCLADQGASFGQPIGVSGCYRQSTVLLDVILIYSTDNVELLNKYL
ncbi:unnamed protein product, partial [Rotaria magnacalcarata]